MEQEFADRVLVGQKVRIKDHANPDRQWTGTVFRLADAYTQRRPLLSEPMLPTDGRTVECLISVSPGQAPLRIGQRVRVIIGPAGD